MEVGGRKRKKKGENGLTYFLPLADQPGELATLCSTAGPKGCGPLRGVAQILLDTTAAPQSAVDVPALNTNTTGGGALGGGRADRKQHKHTHTQL